MTETSPERAGPEGARQAIDVPEPPIAPRRGRPIFPATSGTPEHAAPDPQVREGRSPDRAGDAPCCGGPAEAEASGMPEGGPPALVAGEARPRGAEVGALQHPAGAVKSWDWKMALKMALCCGAPLLALVVLAGGGGLLLGAAGSVLPLLAALACPIGMYFMMRGMSHGHHDGRGDKDQVK
jgi:hypothetical protein